MRFAFPFEEFPFSLNLVIAIAVPIAILLNLFYVDPSSPCGGHYAFSTDSNYWASIVISVFNVVIGSIKC